MGIQLGITGDSYELNTEAGLTALAITLERRVKVAMRTNVPAVVTAFYPPTRTVDLLVANLSVQRLQDPTRIPDRALLVNPGRREITLQPTELKQIPVEFPGTTLGSLTFPITPGDTGMLAVCDRNPKTFLRKGVPTDPVDMQIGKLPHSVFRPGLRTLANALGPVDMTATVLDGPLIKLGATAADFAIKGTTFVAAMDGAIAAAVTAGTGAVGTTGTLAFTAFQTAWNLAKASFTSTKVQVG